MTFFGMGKKRRLIAHQGALLAYATALCNDPQLAADLVQDCAVRVLRGSKAPKDDSAYKAWLFTIIRNLWLDHLRRSSVRNEVSVHGLSDGWEPPTGGETGVVNGLAVRQAFTLLSEDHRDVLALVDIADFSYSETAEILQISIGTVMSRVSRARQALANRLTQDNVVEFSLRKGQ
ncbi:RNA polymerase sigma factor [Rhodovibrionaceae bacterium A322]